MPIGCSTSAYGSEPNPISGQIRPPRSEEEAGRDVPHSFHDPPLRQP
jgi:hypothetical protein